MTSGDRMFIIFCVQVDPDILMRKMREQGLRLNHTNVWDNGRRKGKQYDLGRRDIFIIHIHTLFCRSYYNVLCLYGNIEQSIKIPPVIDYLHIFAPVASDGPDVMLRW